MVRLFYICILAALIVSAPAAEGVTATTLPSGMKVIVREGHSVNLVAIDIWVRAGSVNETAANCGVSHFIEHMIFKATEKYAPGQIDREIETLGADLNGGTMKDYVHFYTTVPSADLGTALQVIADAVVHPKFRAEDMEKERRIILDEIARSEGDPMKHALDLLAGVIFPTHPYGRPMAGTRETIARLTRDDLVSYYSAHFTPANTSVVIAGDVSRADAVAMVEKAFEGYDRKVAPPADAPARDEAFSEPRTKRVPCAASQAYVAVGFRVPGVADFSETCALDALQIVFGDTANGRISTALTTAGIPFTRIKTDYFTQREPTVFSVVAAIDPDDADRVAPVIVDEFRKLARSGVSDGELSYARRLIEGSELFEQETFAGQARALGFWDVLESYELSLKYAETVRGITPEDISNLARKHFTTEGYGVVILAPEVAE